MRFFVVIAALFALAAATPMPQNCGRDEFGVLCCKNCGENGVPSSSQASSPATPSSV
ncbi:hypothetical protein AURDEDRAFT_160305 [Auricularia subglabra TFB-10046 SS5]|nr:hypothetical protein AURDEDRAFT_160305 [Auricularia subglabra TFB-10046 SS5]